MRLIEAFGPTIQGEGPLAGRVCHFLRLGGCDYRCDWCDTPYAVAPAAVRAAEDLTAGEVAARLAELEPAPLLVISGGNPALWRLDELVGLLRRRYAELAVETQGSRWRDWLGRIDSLVVSPKPPSSGEATERNLDRFKAFMRSARGHAGLVLKVVAFDFEDLMWAKEIHRAYPRVPFYLSAGTEQGEEDPLPAVADRYRWLCEAVSTDEDLAYAVVLPQLHVIAWGNRVGV